MAGNSKNRVVLSALALAAILLPLALADSGCSDGTREGFKDETVFPNLAACSGSFTVPGIISKKPACDRKSGTGKSGLGCSAADLCAAGWHVCSSYLDVRFSSGKPDPCNEGGLQSFFAAGQSTKGNLECTLEEDARDDVFGCYPSEFGSSEVLRPKYCDILNAGISSARTFPNWDVGSGKSDIDEADVVIKYDSDDGSGVLCCKDEPCNCPEGHFCSTGCSDGIREWYLNSTRHQFVAGCSGGWTVPGITKDAYGNVQNEPKCDRNAGDDSTNPDGIGCSAADLCGEGWQICDSSDHVFRFSGTRTCDLESECNSVGFYATGQSLNYRGECSDFGSHSASGLVGCGPANLADKSCPNPNLDGKYSGSKCSALGRSWSCTAGSELTTATKTGDAPGGVMCCRTAFENCTPCPLGSFKSSSGAHLCELCKPGRYADSPKSTSCSDCLAGSYSDASGASSCTLCDSGTFSATQGSTSCTECDEGFCADEPGATTCVPCPGAPTSSPTVSPTVEAPTTSPTPASPTEAPSATPTLSPTTVSPTAAPSTESPTDSPTSSPTSAPTAAPTAGPTRTPSDAPTAAPTGSPTGAPTSSPTVSPSSAPTSSPTAGPTAAPTGSPSDAPSIAPTAGPTAAPTAAPTVAPTGSPTVAPTTAPTASPTAGPTSSPTAAPTLAPTLAPTSAPTTSPTVAPTSTPTMAPTSVPTLAPTGSPTAAPTSAPTVAPTPEPTLAGCRPGTYVDSNGVCVPCKGGSFSSSYNSSSCLPCPSGTYSPSGSKVCTDCPEGTYSLEDSSACKSCLYDCVNYMKAQLSSSVFPHIVINLNASTDCAGKSWTKCEPTDIFAEPTSSTLGSGAICVWHNSSCVSASVRFGSGATLLYNETLSLSSSLIVNVADQRLPASAYQPLLLYPLGPPSVIISLSAPLTLGLCDSLVVDASSTVGLAGRPGKWTWTVSITAPTGSLLKSYITESTSNILSVPSTDIPAGSSVTVKAEVESWLKIKGTPVEITTQKLGFPVPALDVSSSVSEVFVNLNAKLSVHNVTCTDSSSTTSVSSIKFSWSRDLSAFSNSELNEYISSASSSALVVPRSLFVAGLKESISVTVAVVTKFQNFTYNYNLNGTTDFIPGPRQVFCLISGGTERTVTPAGSLIIDGSSSRDPDHFSNQEYAWTVKCSNSTKCDALSSFFAERTETVFSIPADLLEAHSSLEVHLKITASDNISPSIKHESCVQTISVADIAVPSVKIYVRNPRFVQDLRDFQGDLYRATYVFNVDDLARLEGIVENSDDDSEVFYKWTCFAEQAVLNLSQENILKSYADSSNLVLNMNEIYYGVSKVFYLMECRLEASFEQSFERSGSSVVSLFINAGPFSGELDVIPSSGFAGKTVFEFFAPTFVSSFAPLFYLFEVRSTQDETTVLKLSPEGSSNIVTTTLPAGSWTSRVIVRDAIGGVRTILNETIIVVSLQPGLSNCDILRQELDALQKDEAVLQNADLILSRAQRILVSIKSGSVKECSSWSLEAYNAVLTEVEKLFTTNGGSIAAIASPDQLLGVLGALVRVDSGYLDTGNMRDRVESVQDKLLNAILDAVLQNPDDYLRTSFNPTWVDELLDVIDKMLDSTTNSDTFCSLLNRSASKVTILLQLLGAQSVVDELPKSIDAATFTSFLLRTSNFTQNRNLTIAQVVDIVVDSSAVSSGNCSSLVSDTIERDIAVFLSDLSKQFHCSSKDTVISNATLEWLTPPVTVEVLPPIIFSNGTSSSCDVSNTTNAINWNVTASIPPIVRDTSGTLQENLDKCGVKSLFCGFYNSSTSAWESTGCTLSAVGSSSASCVCNHLTDFALIYMDTLECTSGSGINDSILGWNRWYMWIFCFLFILEAVFTSFRFEFMSSKEEPLKWIVHVITGTVAVLRAIWCALHAFSAWVIAKAVFSILVYILYFCNQSVATLSWREIAGFSLESGKSIVEAVKLPFILLTSIVSCSLIAMTVSAVVLGLEGNPKAKMVFIVFLSIFAVAALIQSFLFGYYSNAVKKLLTEHNKAVGDARSKSVSRNQIVAQRVGRGGLWLAVITALAACVFAASIVAVVKSDKNLKIAHITAETCMIVLLILELIMLGLFLWTYRPAAGRGDVFSKYTPWLIPKRKEQPERLLSDSASATVDKPSSSKSGRSV